MKFSFHQAFYIFICRLLLNILQCTECAPSSQRIIQPTMSIISAELGKPSSRSQQKYNLDAGE